MIKRTIQEGIQKDLFKGMALLLFGPRQTGKSTLMQEILNDQDHLYLNGDDADVREILTNTTANNRFPQTFTENYPNTRLMVVSPANVETFLMKEISL